MPWAHGHQRKALGDLVQAIIAQQTGGQVQLARSFGNQEAAAQWLSRLLHNERLEPRAAVSAGTPVLEAHCHPRARCARQADIVAPANVGLRTPLSFRDNGKQMQECEVRL